jgi:signal peptidase I
MKKISTYFGFGLIIMVLTATILVSLVPHFGWRADAVLSGSMEPHLKVGGLAITHNVNEEDIKVGDTITFYSPLNKKLTSHRVISITKDPNLLFQTKGDVNEDPDPFVVPTQNVVGKVCYHIPYLGYIAQFIKSRLGFLFIVFLPGLIIIGMELKNIWRVLNEQTARKRDIRVG